MTARFQGKRVYITGAASGMGQATALQLGAEGAELYCVDLNSEGVQNTVDAIKDAGGKATAATLNVTSKEDCVASIAAAVEVMGGLDILLNVAGLGGIARFENETEQAWKLAFAVNVDGPFFLSQTALPHLLESKGNIVNVCSTAGMKGQAYMSSYVASKHALRGLTQTMALEFGKRGIRINAVCPGGTKTAFLAAFSNITEDMDISLIERNGLQEEMADAADIAKSICFLASDDASFVNGAMFSVDGGSTAG
ncbi:NAD(P)-dependent oxidoreductase [Endozoicomonas sp. OPT23]|uniref:SDR family NAD(P)-dependent oxidoreductase n=1 Tax=Endozoicomonas sp. OPT23 TaxID=2072845 RepID=UPI00129A344F|nr:SDR family oxidoreductase [Endozoicomonas sp. OPT23]MRI31531.1 NAD(P)-dependent oxidoreductase [Endozoicomonas sp. OPT23]